jgi:hypothetical protein
MLCPATPFLDGADGGALVTKKNGARTTATGTAQGKRRRKRKHPPWGNLLGGKPIERCDFVGGKKLDLGDGFAQRMQYRKMRRLIHHFGIVSPFPLPVYPIAGVGDASWWPWYQLALAIASELDDSLKIVDGQPRGKTAARWRGDEGALLLELVDYHRQKRPGCSIRWYLRRLQTVPPNFYGGMPLNELVVRYHEARRHHRGTKRAPKRAGGS